MRVAQDLYENGYITYMRTDSTDLSDDGARPRPATRCASSTGPTTCRTQPRTYARKVKNAQEAHEAIRPAGETFRTPDSLAGELRRRRAPPLRPHLEADRRLADERRPRPQRVGAPGRHHDRRARRRARRRRGRTITSRASCGPTWRGPTIPTPSSTTARPCCRTWPRATRCRCRPSRPRATPPSRRPATPRRRWSSASRSWASAGRPPTPSILQTIQDRGYVVEAGHRARADLHGVRGDPAAGEVLRRPRRLRVHRPDGGRPRRDRRGARASGCRGSSQFWFGATTATRRPRGSDGVAARRLARLEGLKALID